MPESRAWGQKLFQSSFASAGAVLSCNFIFPPLLPFGGRWWIFSSGNAWQLSKMGFASKVAWSCWSTWAIESCRGFWSAQPFLPVRKDWKISRSFYFWCKMHSFLPAQQVCGSSGAGCLQPDCKPNPASKASKGLLAKESVHTCTVLGGWLRGSVSAQIENVILGHLRKIKGIKYI